MRQRQIDTSTATITGGTINGATIGATTPASGAFTTISATTTATVGASIQAPLLIGGTGTASTLTLSPTSGVGASGADIIFNVGNNGATEAMRIKNSGGIGISASPPAGTSFSIAKSITGAATAYGTYSAGVVQSDVTTRVDNFASVLTTQAAAFSLNDYNHYRATAAALGSGSAVTNQYGFHASSALTGGANNYGFYSNIASGANRWNFFASGTANNAFVGNVRIGSTTVPTAKVHLDAGTATASTAPLKLTAGTNLTTPETGAVEFDGANFFVTAGATRYTMAKVLTGSATLDFPNTSAGASSDLTITVIGAAESDPVDLGVPNSVVLPDSVYAAWVSAADTVTVRFDNTSGGAKNPIAGLFKVVVHKTS